MRHRAGSGVNASRSFVLVESEGLSRAQNFYQLLNALGVWLPFIAVAVTVLSGAGLSTDSGTPKRYAAGRCASISHHGASQDGR